MARWQVQKAKSHFSDLLEEAKASGPQIITRHGTECAVVLSMEEYRSVTGRKDFVDHILSAPDFGDVQIERSPDTGRPVLLED